MNNWQELNPAQKLYFAGLCETKHGVTNTFSEHGEPLYFDKEAMMVSTRWAYLKALALPHKVPVPFEGVRQTIFSDEKAGTIGNCLAACVSTITGIPIDEMPHFAWYGGDWFRRMSKFLDANGFELLGTWVIKNNPDWAEKFHGVDDMCIVGGKSPRLYWAGHAVVYYKDMPWWDPHPDDTFLTEAEDVYLIRRKGADDEGVVHCSMCHRITGPALDSGCQHSGKPGCAWHDPK